MDQVATLEFRKSLMDLVVGGLDRVLDLVMESCTQELDLYEVASLELDKELVGLKI